MIVDGQAVSGEQLESQLFEHKYDTLKNLMLNTLTEEQLDELESLNDSDFTTEREKLVMQELLQDASDFDNEKSARNEVDLD